MDNKQEESTIDLNAALETESKILAEKKRNAEEKRKKRAMFLNNMDTFSQEFQTKTLEEEQKRKLLFEREKSVLNEQISDASSSYVLSPQQSSILQDQDVDSMSQLTVSKISSQLPPQDSFASPQQSHTTILSSDLFSKKPEEESSNSEMTEDPKKFDNELSKPMRIGGRNISLKTENEKNLESSISAGGVRFVDEQESDEEGTGDVNRPHVSHFLTKDERKALSAEEKAAWKALQADLTSKRKDFHGAVTYAFGGIFSWQMYGSAEAVDELGKEYTEYLMRCQWGTSWENLQPWIAARRYREFDKLDFELKRNYPQYSHTMPKLPEKDYFRFLEADVIAKRRRNIQEYISIIVSTMPTLLRSHIMDEFLGISERIKTIKTKLINGQQDDSSSHAVDMTTDFSVITSSREQRPVPLPSSGHDQVDSSSDDLTVVTADMAESLKVQTGANAFDEDGLGDFEENLRDLITLLRHASAPDLSRGGKIRSLLISCTNRWPQLRATCELGNGIDFVLIPRGMQAEEDLIRCLSEYKSLIAAHLIG